MVSLEATEHHTLSRDGTSIGYLSSTSGDDLNRTSPRSSLVLVSGSGVIASQETEPALTLSRTYTVHRMERRGRGLSPCAFSETHCIERDVEDIEAVMRATGSKLLYGMSSAGTLVLSAARTLGSDVISHVAVYEPQFYLQPKYNYCLTDKQVERFKREVEQEAYAAAVVTVFQSTGMVPPFLATLADVALRPVLWTLIAADRMRAKPGTSIIDMLQALRFDWQAVAKADLEEYVAGLQGRKVFIMHGDQSQAFLQDAARYLAEHLPDARYRLFKGMKHTSVGDSKCAGQVAEETIAFFAT